VKRGIITEQQFQRMWLRSSFNRMSAHHKFQRGIVSRGPSIGS
jgi:hypothetical protein